MSEECTPPIMADRRYFRARMAHATYPTPGSALPESVAHTPPPRGTAGFSPQQPSRDILGIRNPLHPPAYKRIQGPSIRPTGALEAQKKNLGEGEKKI